MVPVTGLGPGHRIPEMGAGKVKSDRFGVAVGRFGLRFGPAGAKWVQDVKKHGFGVLWGHLGVKSGHFRVSGSLRSPIGPLEMQVFKPAGCSLDPKSLGRSYGPWPA